MPSEQKLRLPQALHVYIQICHAIILEYMY